jgi:hypothetical protein
MFLLKKSALSEAYTFQIKCVSMIIDTDQLWCYTVNTSNIQDEKKSSGQEMSFTSSE